MGYHTKCTRCYGNPHYKSWHGNACAKCNGTGHETVAYRRALTLKEGALLGWSELASSPRYGDEHSCIACNKALPRRRRSFCSELCRIAYLRRVWKGAHWQKRAVAIRDGAACRACGELHESPIVEGGKPYPLYSELELDHAKPLHLGGTEHPDNCQLLCVACHRKKTTRERFGTQPMETTE